MSGPLFVPYLQRELGGATAVNVFALLSSFALASVAARVVWLAIRRYIYPDAVKPREYVFFSTQLGHYATCLLFANLFVDLAGLIGIKWLVDKGITEGPLCTTQAILMQIGNWSTAYFTVTIAVHTFNSLVLRRRQSALVCVITAFIGWTSAAILAAGPFTSPSSYKFGPGYGIDGLSCGVRSVYLKAQFFFHLFPIFVASVLSAILYSVIFLVLRGTLHIKGGIKLTFDPNARWVVGDSENYHRFVARIARSMLWYPAAYIALLIPYSVTRLLAISGFTVAFESKIFAYVCWFMLGIVNVLLLYNTFRVLGPAFDGQISARSQQDNESFASPEDVRRYSPSISKGQGFDEKHRQYPTPPHQLNTTEMYTQASPVPSIKPLLPVHQERVASVQSYYSYPTSPSIGRTITPVDELERTLSQPEPAAQKFVTSERLKYEHGRQSSTDSVGLPAPPRSTRSPVEHYPSIESIRTPVRTVKGTWTPVSPHMDRQQSTHTLGKPHSGERVRDSTNSALSVELDTSNSVWRSRQQLSPPPTSTSVQGSGAPAQPLLSAFNSGFPAGDSSNPGSPRSLRPLPNLPRHSRSFSAVPTIGPAPVGRQRAVLPLDMDAYGHVRSSSTQTRPF